MKAYANIILPIHVGVYTYKVPFEMQSEISVGMRVLVPLGKNRKYIGIILSFTNVAAEGINYKEILEVLDSEPIVSQYPLQLERNPTATTTSPTTL